MGCKTSESAEETKKEGAQVVPMAETEEPAEAAASIAPADVIRAAGAWCLEGGEEVKGICPITQHAMYNPITAPDGFTYERSALVAWVRARGTSPLTGQALDMADIEQHDASEVKEERSPEWKQKVKDLAGRGFTLRDLLKFCATLYDSNSPMPHFDASRSTTRDVVRQALIPLSSVTQTSFAEVLDDGSRGHPGKMVTHHWANLFMHTVAAIVADACDSPRYGDIADRLSSAEGIAELTQKLGSAGKLELRYWVCAFSVNQHCSICGGVAPGRVETDAVTGEEYTFCDCKAAKHFSGDLCEMNKFDEMMYTLTKEVRGFGQVVAVDGNFEIFSRAWCIAELAEARKRDMPQKLVVCRDEDLETHRGVLENLDVSQCDAARKEDKDIILAKIPNIDEFNKELRELVQGKARRVLSQLKSTDKHQAAGFVSCSRVPPAWEVQLSQAVRDHDSADVHQALCLPEVDVNMSIVPLRNHGRPLRGFGKVAGDTYLHIAIRNFDPAVVRVLLLHGADPTIRNSKSQDAIQLLASEVGPEWQFVERG